MNSASKILLGIVAGLGLAGWLLYWLHACPVCPEAKTATTVRIDTVYIHDTVAPARIKVTKVVKPKIVKTDIPPNCDSLLEQFNSEYYFTIPVSDSIMTGEINTTISQNMITDFSTSFKYHLQSRVDSVVQFVPLRKNTFTLGMFLSKHSAGAAFGYRTDRIQTAIGYDVTNSVPVLHFNYDLR